MFNESENIARSSKMYYTFYIDTVQHIGNFGEKKKMP